jgi:hypothetical protein
MSEASAFPEPAAGAVLRRVVFGFIAGFIAVPVFHQVMVIVLNAVGLVAWTPYRMSPVPPFGVPAVVSSSFWGGVWGIVFALLAPLFPRGGWYWVTSVLFGALALTIVAWIVVAPLKGMPLFFGGDPRGMLAGLLVNGAWGIGVALMLRPFAQSLGFPQPTRRNVQ